MGGHGLTALHPAIFSVLLSDILTDEVIALELHRRPYAPVSALVAKMRAVHVDQLKQPNMILLEDEGFSTILNRELLQSISSNRIAIASILVTPQRSVQTNEPA